MQKILLGVIFLSIINQVNMCIRKIDRIAVSKRNYRDNDKKHYIHSHAQKEKTERISKEFANFCRSTYDIRHLHNVTEEHYRHFLATKSETTLGHQRNIETALQQLQKGLKIRAERYDKEPTVFMTERLTPPAERDENVTDRSYTPEEIEKIKSGVTDNTKTAIELMSNLGMRVHEAVAVKVENINFEDNRVSIIGKGGLYREIPFKDDFKAYLNDLTKSMDKSERLVKTAQNTVSDNCKKVADKIGVENWSGTHGFRHSYARNEINGTMTVEEKEKFVHCIENYAEGKRFDYGIDVEKDKLYVQMKSKMDQVHKYLGHGENRFDLALRYMR